jgi:hypothetical protein
VNAPAAQIPVERRGPGIFRIGWDRTGTPRMARLSESFNSDLSNIRCFAFTVSHEGPYCQPRISWAARPAIMCVDAAVPGPVMIRGITEASATRNPETP